MEVAPRSIAKVAKLKPEYMSIMGSGLTASLALSEVGQMRSGQTILVTAAAGATGIFAVQLAKLAGNKVIGTCSSDEKVEYLRSLGCDRPVNYKKENLSKVLASEFPNGYEDCAKSAWLD